MNAGSAVTVAVLRSEARGRRDRLRQRHPEVDPVDQGLQHGGDDRRAAGRADREERLAVAQHDGRRDRASAAACRAGSGSGRCASQAAVKSVSSLFSRNPRPGTSMPSRRSARWSGCTRRRCPSGRQVTRWVVDLPWSLRPADGAVRAAAAGRASPGATGVTSRVSGWIRQARESANRLRQQGLGRDVDEGRDRRRTRSGRRTPAPRRPGSGAGPAPCGMRRTASSSPGC